VADVNLALQHQELADIDHGRARQLVGARGHLDLDGRERLRRKAEQRRTIVRQHHLLDQDIIITVQDRDRNLLTAEIVLGDPDIIYLVEIARRHDQILIAIGVRSPFLVRGRIGEVCRWIVRILIVGHDICGRDDVVPADHGMIERDRKCRRRVAQDEVLRDDERHQDGTTLSR
jgi:nucleotide-binding universal stress UspA family protein